jgi:hypothetical protein
MHDPNCPTSSPPTGHVPLVFDGAEILQFQSAEEMAKTTEVMARNMQAVGAPPGG